jgi:hypothetical protein
MVRLKARAKRLPLAKARRKFRVGDHVRFPLGRRTVSGTVIEIRGPIGIGGRTLVRVRVKTGPMSGFVIEVPVQDLRRR